jgi:hypothetical protein
MSSCDTEVGDGVICSAMSLNNLEGTLPTEFGLLTAMNTL